MFKLFKDAVRNGSEFIMYNELDEKCKIRLRHFIFGLETGYLDSAQRESIYNSIVRILNFMDNESVDILKTLVNTGKKINKVIYHVQTFYNLLKEYCNYDLLENNDNDKDLLIEFDNLKRYVDFYMNLYILFEVIYNK